VAQGDFRLYAYLGDEKALHVHDVRILKPGFSIVPADYVVGLVRPRHLWMLEEPAAASSASDRLAASS
jgi:hypothetical protein